MSLLHLFATTTLVLTASVALADFSSAPTLTFIGTTSDWYVPSNWDLGRAPQPGDNVILDGGHAVVIDPANDPNGTGMVRIQDLIITEGASLETLAGVRIRTRDEDISDGGQLIHRSTRAVDDPTGGTLTVGQSLCPNCGGVVLNPTPKSKRDVLLQSSVTFGLGGTIAATNTVAGAYGPGHYATLTTETATLGGTLDVETFYGFAPALGDSFEILTVDGERTGEFAGLVEGALVDSFGDVGLYISYRGGDGNDVVLTAAALVKTE